MQLVAYGAQDIYLTGNPQITFFKVVYRRHTNFSMELIQQTWNGTIAASGRTSCTISRNGDLVHRMYLMTLVAGSIAATCGDNPGHNVIDNVVCEIGGQLVDKHYGHWMETHAQLTEENPGTVANGAIAVLPPQTHTPFQRMALAGGVQDAGASPLTNSHFIPLRFWFCRNPGLALPLIALQYHEVKVIVEWSAAVGSSTAFTGMQLMAQYIYLDTDERRRFAQVSHEYLIEQVQHQTASASLKTTDLNFNHPVKELVWTGQGAAAWGAADATAGTPSVITSAGDTKWNIKLNGHDRMSLIDTNYYTLVQRWENHTGGVYFGAGEGVVSNSIAVYSFALKPEEHQPSGTCNFSRIDNAQLVADTAWTAQGLHIYAVNYNVLRIMSGMGGLAYSN